MESNTLNDTLAKIHIELLAVNGHLSAMDKKLDWLLDNNRAVDSRLNYRLDRSKLISISEILLIAVLLYAIIAMVLSATGNIN